MKRGCKRFTVATLALTLLTACSPQVSGTGGVRFNSSGQLVAVLAWCENFGYPATIALYPVSSHGGVGEPLLRLERTSGAPHADHAEISLTDPGPAWHSDRVTPFLEEDKSYELRAWDRTGNHRVTSFPFAIAELRSADPTRPILTKAYTGDDRYDSSLVGLQEFRQTAAKACDS